MNLHLVFNPSITIPLAESLQTRGHTITGTDATLEQFAIAAGAGKIEADIAVVDGVLGIVHKRESIRLLKEIRMYLPDVRLIVLLPEFDLEWQKNLGMYGIYDIYSAEQFDVEDVLKWIETRKTLADVPYLADGLPERYAEKVESQTRFSNKSQTGKIQSVLQRFRNAKSAKTDKTALDMADMEEETEVAVTEALPENSEPSTEQEAEKEELDEKKKVEQSLPQVEKPQVPCVYQPYIVGVGGLMKRSGNTHTAIQIAYETSCYGFRTALVEYRSQPRPSDIIAFATDFDGLKFHRQGIDFFPNRSPFDVAEIYSFGYEVVVLDLSVLVDEQEDKLAFDSGAQEFLRSPIQMLTLSAAPWDLHKVVRHLKDIQTLLRKSSLVVNYADSDMMKDIQELFVPVPALFNLLSADPFTTEGKLAYWLDQPKEKKKRWFMH
ncbi:hypothetical protein J1TS5_04100 [Paenibacillus macerans]|uniref:hypothetical protein n=1 Tax=Paenibacillus macerans TaxID=44252 RepID=UPI001B2D30D9|nr:hypothetical protein [Paenibacillus macerans]GIP08240.1 hypothetical protein J1TS5_04100 [Paenibacillus macerans]